MVTLLLSLLVAAPPPPDTADTTRPATVLYDAHITPQNNLAAQSLPVLQVGDLCPFCAAAAFQSHIMPGGVCTRGHRVVNVPSWRIVKDTAQERRWIYSDTLFLRGYWGTRERVYWYVEFTQPEGDSVLVVRTKAWPRPAGAP